MKSKTIIAAAMRRHITGLSIIFAIMAAPLIGLSETDTAATIRTIEAKIRELQKQIAELQAQAGG